MAFRKKNSKPYNYLFMSIPFSVWDSPAMRACDTVSRVIFIEIVRRYNGFNNGKISLSVREAAYKANVSPGTANKSIHKLVKVGLIKITKNSGFNMKGRLARLFEITFRKKDYEPSKNTY